MHGVDVREDVAAAPPRDAVEALNVMRARRQRALETGADAKVPSREELLVTPTRKRLRLRVKSTQLSERSLFTPARQQLLTFPYPGLVGDAGAFLRASR